MSASRQKDAVESLQAWSQWVIGLGFAATTGCVLVLQGGAEGRARLFLILAITAFALSLLCALFLVRVLATLMERLPLESEDGRPRGLEDHPLGHGLTIGRLARLQSWLLALGGGFFLAWVVV
ncbi:hypothetical protein [Halomonas salifodinae]|uniref:hypothetical protein n=1 Tax=Halomonas salifodinae TaxID=438745 RepID=UPI0033ABBB5E